MRSTALRRKIIDIPEDTFRNLSILAAQEGKSLKSYIEGILISQARYLSDEEIYQVLIAAEPDGKIPATKEEQSEFEKWLEE
jgi:hypothetical protein